MGFLNGKIYNGAFAGAQARNQIKTEKGDLGGGLKTEITSINGWRIIFVFFSAFWDFFWDFCLAGRVVCLFHGANRCIPWLPFIFQSFNGRLVCFSPVFFGFERFCFVLAVFGRVSRDLHTYDH